MSKSTLVGRAALVALLFSAAAAPPLAAAERGTPLAGTSLVAGPAQVGTPWTGARGASRRVADIMDEQAHVDAARAADAALRAQKGLPPEPPKERIEHEIEHDGMKPNPNSPLTAAWPPADLSGMLRASAAVPLVPQTPGVQFTGAIGGASGTDAALVPPDTMGAIGPTQYVTYVNGRIRTFTRAGVADGVLNADTDVFWGSVQTGGTSDPRIRFDRLSNRWILVMIDITVAGVNNDVLLAVSSGPVIASTSSFTFFKFRQDAPLPTGDTSCFADYPSVGVDANAVLIGVNQFCGVNQDFYGGDVFVVRKSSLLAGGPLVVTAFRKLTGATPVGAGNTGITTPQGVDNDDPAATESYFVGDDNSLYGLLNILRISNPGGTPSMTPLTLTVPQTSLPIPLDVLGNNHPGGTYNGKVDASDTRVIQSQIVNGNLFTTHGVSVNSSGVAQGATSGDRDAVRWYRIGNLSTTPTLLESGTIFDAAASNPLSYTYGSMAVTGQGHAAFGMTSGGLASYLAAAQAGRLATDAAGFVNTPVTYQAGAGAYLSFDSGTSRPRRWGDYTATLVDPTDNMTVWTAQEYCQQSISGNSHWGVRVAELKAPPPAGNPATVTANSAPQGSTLTVTVSGTSTAGSAYYEPGPAFPKHLAMTFSGTGVTATSLSTVTPTSFTAFVTVSNGAATGPRDVTVTNPDGQSVTYTGAFTVTANASCAGLTLSPAALPAANLGSPYSQALTPSGGGPYTTWNVSGGALPAGITLTAGGVLTGTPTVGGSYSFTVSAGDGTCTIVQAFTLSVVSYTITASAGSSQSAAVNTAFATALQATVVDSGSLLPVSGVTVTFTAPASGASGSFPGPVAAATATTNASGIATAPAFTANGTAGSYAVGATAPGAAGSASFALTNFVPCTLVTSNANAGAGSLRDCIAQAATGGTITFDPAVTGTITLASELLISRSVTITGPGARVLAVSGNGASRVFTVTAGTVTISGLTITGGNGQGTGSTTIGGGVYLSGGANLTLDQVAVVGNSASTSAGGIYNSGSTLLLRASTLANNVASSSVGDGGGLWATGAHTTDVVNCTVTGNRVGASPPSSTSAWGGGLRNTTGTLSVFNSTVVNNTGGHGGNAYRESGTFNIRNSVFAGGIVPAGAATNGIDLYGTFVSQDYNLIQSTTAATVNGSTANNVTGVAPGLNALANNGGPTDTMAPSSAASPILNKITAPALLGPGNVALTTDQRGLARPDIAHPNGGDIGAYEDQAGTPVELKSFDVE